MPGVNVLEKGTKNGTSTDFDGRYKIKLSNPKAILSFSFIGFKTKDVSAEGKTKVDMVLIEDSNNLNEVVVIGYGTAKKGDLTGAVSTISGNDLKKVPVANVAEALTGRIAGVQVTSSEGSPDSEIKIRIRGGGSLTQDGSPLLIVDGFPVNSINDISPSDVETVTVLKDASSTAIYGSRGANGVIIITTKGGLKAATSIVYNGYMGVAESSNHLDMLSADQWRGYVRQNGITDAIDYGGNTNWQKELERKAFSQSHTISISSSGEQGGLRSSLSYLKNEGIVKTTGLERLSANLSG